MQQLTAKIDGHAVSVEPGTTVLEAARRLGIHIPTLCHVPGIEPAASCFLCAVQVEGKRTLAPACATAVTHNMVVTTDNDDLRGARKMALELLLSDHAGECIAQCVAKCPAGLDIPSFVYELTTRNSQACMEIITDRLALPGSLGRICPRLCELHCRRCEHDEGLAIGALHRKAADVDRHAIRPFVPPRAPTTNRSVAIVGAGPAGLAAAYFLLQKGHDCSLYDAHSEPGGMLRYGIPAYRLPKDALDAEIDAVRALGAEFRMNTRWGKDFSLPDLRQRHDAVFLAIGAQGAVTLGCEGEALAMSGVSFLEQCAKGASPPLGDSVLVVGGGNTAMDCARSAIRLGAREVRVLYRRTAREMPCLMDEVHAAKEEGVALDCLVAPTRLTRIDDQRLLLTCLRMELGEPDSSGRHKPVPIAGSEFDLPCTTVIAAIGQSVDRSLAEREGLSVTAWGIKTNERTLATDVPGVFAGGDAVLGADLAVRAVAAGRIAATSIDQFLRGEAVRGEGAMVNVSLRPIDERERAALFRSIEASARVNTPQICMQRRLESFDEVETGLTDEEAQREAHRCMTCGCRKADCCRVRVLATEYDVDVGRFAGARRRHELDNSHPEIVYESGKCIMCDACVRIAAQAGEELGVALIGRGFDITMAVPFDRPLSEGLRKVARRCAQACPSGALTLRDSRTCSLSACATCDTAATRPTNDAPGNCVQVGLTHSKVAAGNGDREGNLR